MTKLTFYYRKIQTFTVAPPKMIELKTIEIEVEANQTFSIPDIKGFEVFQVIEQLPPVKIENTDFAS